MVMTFDTLRAAQRLRDEANQPPAAAETIAAVIGEAVAPGRDDVGALRGELRDSVAALREDIAALRADMYAAMFRLAGFTVAVAVAVATVAVAVAKLT